MPSPSATSAPSSVPVLVLGTGITTLGVIRNLGRKRIPRCVVGADGFVPYSRWYRAAPTAAAQVATRESLTRLLLSLPYERMVLMPCSDAWMAAAGSLDPSLSSRFPASLSRPESLEVLIDKGRFADTLVSLGIPHPRTACPTTEDELQSLPEDAFEAGFLKPRSSQAFQRQFDVKAFRFSGKAEAMERFRDAHRAGLAVMVQEYVPGPPTEHYFVDGFVDREGCFRARFVRRRLRMFPPDFGNSTYMVSVPLEEAAGAVESVERLLRGLCYRGIFSAEFKRDPRDGRFKILEVNTRPWWYVEFAASCGVDVCEMAYRDALGLPVEPVDSYRVGRHSVYPYYDRDACRTLRARGELSTWSWLRSWALSEQPVLCWDDLVPAIFGFVDELHKTVRRRLQA